MITTISVVNSFSVDDIEKAKDFYINILGLKLENEDMGLSFILPGGGKLLVYNKSDHQPATFTVLNCVVDDIEKAVDELAQQGVKFEIYDNLPAKQDERGILRGLSVNQGPDIAWFKDPAGNIISALQDK